MDTSVISTRGLTKAFGSRLAVDDLSFDVHGGRVTGFLGPNGAGKTTTMRLILGLAHPTSGTAAVFGRPYVELDRPVWRVGGRPRRRVVPSPPQCPEPPALACRSGWRPEGTRRRGPRGRGPH